MSRPYVRSPFEGQKEPHSVSLKVLRISRPSLSYQHALPKDNDTFSTKASMSYPSESSDADFILSPNLTLLPSFGSAYVGETFSCSLCANNELISDKVLEQSASPARDRIVNGIRVSAEMQTPSQVIPLDLLAADTPESHESPEGLGDTTSGKDDKDKAHANKSIQRILSFDLKEEGNHVLAVSVSYTETFLASSPKPRLAGQDPLSEAHAQYPYSPYGNIPGLMNKSTSMLQAAGGRVRTFRKLYQFIAQPCLSVRTKTTELAPKEVDDPRRSTERRIRKKKLSRFALEAQVENVGDGPIVLAKMHLAAKPPFTSTSLNQDLMHDSQEETPDQNTLLTPPTRPPLLAPRDVQQLAFLIEEDAELSNKSDNSEYSPEIGGGRTSLGQLSLEWRGRMGGRGFLTTGNLMTKRR